MNEIFKDSVYFGVVISLASYGIGTVLKRKFKLAIFNPLLVSIILILGVLVVCNIDYEVYNEGGKYISFLLTPATICLAVPLYEQFSLLKKNFFAIFLGITSGVISSMFSIFLMALVFGLNNKEYITVLPKSITTAIGMGVSEELGGVVPITVAIIVITGIIGNIFAEVVCKVFRITNPIAKGIAIGTSSHALGTAKAMEIGEIEGAMSSLSIVVSGILTVIAAGIFAGFI